MDEQTARQIASQLARPNGEGGVKVTSAMNQTNAFITARAWEALAPEADECMLEIGPGNGRLTRAVIASLAAGGRYLGFEYHDDIAAIARETFAGCEANVEVRSGDFLAHPPEPQAFDGLLAVNVVYFFEDLHALATRCREWLRPGGRAVFGMRSLPALAALPFVAHGFHLRPLDEFLRVLHRAGFEAVQAHFFDEGTTKLAELEVAVDSIIVSAIRR